MQWIGELVIPEKVRPGWGGVSGSVLNRFQFRFVAFSVLFRNYSL